MEIEKDVLGVLEIDAFSQRDSCHARQTEGTHSSRV